MREKGFVNERIPVLQPVRLRRTKTLRSTVVPEVRLVGADDAECGTRRQRPQLPQAGIEPRTF